MKYLPTFTVHIGAPSEITDNKHKYTEKVSIFASKYCMCIDKY